MNRPFTCWYRTIKHSSKNSEEKNFSASLRSWKSTCAKREKLAGADVAAVSVGQQGMPSTIPLIASALIK
jgi:hypothetical protein